MEEHSAVEVDPKDLEHAQNMWHNFATGGKYAVIITVLILVGLALAFVKFT